MCYENSLDWSLFPERHPSMPCIGHTSYSLRHHSLQRRVYSPCSHYRRPASSTHSHRANIPSRWADAFSEPYNECADHVGCSFACRKWSSCHHNLQSLPPPAAALPAITSLSARLWSALNRRTLITTTPDFGVVLYARTRIRAAGSTVNLATFP